MRFSKFAVLLTVHCLLFTVVSSAVETNQIPRVIDTPTAGMIDYGSFSLDFRLFTHGGMLTRLEFGVFKIVNLGLGWELNNVIGTENVVVGPPALFFKLRAFEGSMSLPSFAIGYDGQGNFFDKTANEFAQKEKGIFLVFGRELFTPGLEGSIGCNMNDFKKNTLMGFMSLCYTVEDKVAFLAEWDRINYIPDSFVNLGLRMFITEGLSIDIAGRDIGAYNETVTESTTIYRKPERIVKISYSDKF